MTDMRENDNHAGQKLPAEFLKMMDAAARLSMLITLKDKQLVSDTEYELIRKRIIQETGFMR